MNLEEIYERTATLKGGYASKPPLYPSNSSFLSYLPFRFGFPFFVRSLIVRETVLSRGQVVTDDDPQRTNYDVRRLASLVKDLWLRKKPSRFSLRQSNDEPECSRSHDDNADIECFPFDSI